MKTETLGSLNHFSSKGKEKGFIGKQTRQRGDAQLSQVQSVCVCVCVFSEANRNQDHSDVVGTAPPHRLTGQLLASSFEPELLLRQPRPRLHAALLREGEGGQSQSGYRQSAL